MSAMNEREAVELLKLYERLKTKRGLWDGAWQALASLMRPTRIDVRTQRAPGQQQTQAIFDGTAPKAAMDLASALQGSLSPVEMQWFRLVMRQQELNDNYEIRLWLEDCEKRLNLAFQHSNFEGEGHEMYQDLVVFGTGCMLMEEKNPAQPQFSGFRFRTVPPGHYVIQEGPDGNVRKLIRMFDMPYSATVEKWKGAVHPDDQKIAKDRPEESMKLLHAMIPTGRFGGRQYQSIYVAVERKYILQKQLLRRFKFLVPRWTKSSGEDYGRGQGHIAYPDVATLNRAVEMRFKQWAKSIDPPIVTLDDGVIGRMSTMPGARIVARMKDAVTPLQFGANFNVAQFNEADLIAKIRNTFFADKLQLPSKSYMTATEIQHQVEIMQRELGPTIGRVKFELLTQMIDIGFDIMMETAALLPPPNALLQAAIQGQGEIQVQYESPLSRSQRTSDILAFTRTVEAIGPVAQAMPELLDNFDLDKEARHIASVAGVAQNLMRPVEEVEKMRAERAKLLEQQRQMAMAQQGADTLRSGAMAAKQMVGAQTEAQENQ